MADNVYIERLWRTIQYEMVHLHSFDTVAQVRNGLPLKANYHAPDAVFAKKTTPTKQELFASFIPAQQHHLGATVMI